MAQRVVVTGLGICCPLGVGVRHTWKKLLEGLSGIVSLPSSPEYEAMPSKVVGTVPIGSEEGQFDESAWVTKGERRTMAQCSVYALCAADEALRDAEWLPQVEEACNSTGVAIGCCMPELEEIASTDRMLASGLYRRVSPYFIPRILVNLPAGHVSMRFGLRGPNHSVSTACAAGLHAVGDAFVTVARGNCDVMVAGGTESCVHPIAFAGFSRMKALSTKFNSAPKTASRPFDSERDGFVLAEGAGFLVLEELQHALRRGAKIYAEVLGYGMSGDAHHITAPSEDGSGAHRSMMAALRDAELAPSEIGHVNVHATSTPLGDAVENRAIKAVFGSHARNLLISAPKASLGHLLGAAGGVESVLTVLAVHEGVSPPTINIHHLDPEFDLNYCQHGAMQWRSNGRRIAITNSFGFGGTNASVCFGEFRK